MRCAAIRSDAKADKHNKRNDTEYGEGPYRFIITDQSSGGMKMNQWMELADRVLGGAEVTNEEALSILNCPDEDILLLMHGAFHIRKRFYGKK